MRTATAQPTAQDREHATQFADMMIRLVKAQGVQFGNLKLADMIQLTNSPIANAIMIVNAAMFKAMIARGMTAEQIETELRIII